MVLMDARMFCAGMTLKAPVYYLYKGSYVLLCRDVCLTEELIGQLYSLARETDGVYIKEEDYEEVWNESLHQYSLISSGHELTYQKIRQDYERVLSKTVPLLGEINASSPAALPLADEIAGDITRDLARLDQSLMLRCINMLNTADSYLYTHCVNVAALNGLIGQWLEMPEEEVKRLIKCGLLHDLGKLKIPPHILNKPDRLTAAEFEAVKRHPIYSREMLVQAGETDEDILTAVLQHHERSNGTGYPQGFNRQQLSVFARVKAVSDVYDAMVSQRCYKEASTPFEILQQFKEFRFSQLDLNIVNIFLDNITFLFIGMRVKLSSGGQCRCVSAQGIL